MRPATFALPDPARSGDFNSCRLLRDVVRPGFRSGAGPHRSLARLKVEPRPYQLVLLLMALRLEPVRLMIADDVDIGKTIETCLIARTQLNWRASVHRAMWARMVSARLRGGAKAVVLALVDTATGLIWPPTVAEGEESTESWRQMFQRARGARPDLIAGGLPAGVREVGEPSALRLSSMAQARSQLARQVAKVGAGLYRAAAKAAKERMRWEVD